MDTRTTKAEFLEGLSDLMASAIMAAKVGSHGEMVGKPLPASLFAKFAEGLRLLHIMAADNWPDAEMPAINNPIQPSGSSLN